MPCLGISDGRPGDGGGDCSRPPRLGLNLGESEEVDEPIDVIDETERFGDLVNGLILKAIPSVALKLWCSESHGTEF